MITTPDALLFGACPNFGTDVDDAGAGSDLSTLESEDDDEEPPCLCSLVVALNEGN